MEGLIALLIVAVVVAALVLPWIQRGQIVRLTNDLAELRKQVKGLGEQVQHLSGQTPRQAQPEVEPAFVAHESVATPGEPETTTSAAARASPFLAQTPTVQEAVERHAADEAPAATPQISDDGLRSVIEAKLREAEARATQAERRDVEEVATLSAEAPPPPPPQEGPAAPPPPPPPPARPKISWEQQIGARLPVWVGGIALALAGIFLVKYSIDTGLLGPDVRCVLAGVLGLLMLGAAQWVVRRGTVANGERIGQALSGAGIAVLYGTFFAAGSVYGFISPALAFAAMGAVTALAVYLSLSHGQPIAVLGMVGGFVTPGLVSSAEPNAPVLFTYLAALTTGLFVVIRRQQWWWLAWPALGAAYLWVVLWLGTAFVPAHGLWLGLFLVVLSAATFTIIGEQIGREDEHGHSWAWVGLILAAAASVFLMCVVIVRSQFGTTEWALYGALAAGAIALSVRDQERYRYLPWMTMAASAVLFAVWVTADSEFFALVLFLFAMLFMSAGLVMVWRAKDPADWGGLACATALVFYLIAFGRLNEVTEAARVLAPDTIIGSWPIWGIIALALSAGFALVTGRVSERYGSADATAQHLLALFSLTATAFLSLGLSVEISREFLVVAVAGQTLATAWINTRVDIRLLRWGVGALSVLFALLIMPQAIEVVGQAFAMTLGWGRTVPSIPIAAEPVFHLGAPAAMFALASWYLRRQRDDWMVRTFEAAAAILLGVMGYYVIRLFHVPASEVLSARGTSLEGGIITHVLLVYGIALVAGGRRFARETLVVCGLGAAVIAIGRVIQFDIQPLQLLDVWLPMAIGQVSNTIVSLPIALSPVFYLGVPAVLLIALRLVLGPARDDRLVRLIEYVAVVLAGLMGYFLIRQAFHPAAEALTAMGSRFEGGIISQAQIVYAIALVAAGRYFLRTSLINAALVAAGIAVVRIVMFDAEPFVLIAAVIRMTAGTEVDPAWTIAIANAPLFHLGLPAVLLAGFVYILPQQQASRFARFFEYAAITFVGFMGYYLIRHAFNGAETAFNAAGTFLERGVITNAILLFGIALYVGGQRLQRRTMISAGAVAAVLAVFRIGFFDVLTSSPLVAPHDVGALPILNYLLLPYGLPVIWLALFARVLAERERRDLVPTVDGAAQLFLFAWISLNVRQAFQGAVLNAPTLSNSEVYSYSAAWLVLGIGLLIGGTMRKDPVMRWGSLAVIALTVAKVFLYDASELTGLWTFASFFGLGLSLMGIGWFYSRYVFTGDAAKPT